VPGAARKIASATLRVGQTPKHRRIKISYAWQHQTFDAAFFTLPIPPYAR
jgi:hypothetical protein